MLLYGVQYDDRDKDYKVVLVLTADQADFLATGQSPDDAAVHEITTYADRVRELNAQLHRYDEPDTKQEPPKNPAPGFPSIRK